ncbi:MAG: head-tail connector protein [Aquamicrobium sp.]|uniref:head-tail connector protein n=1 Tax=Aquamicrobium sp. TaxID=1872579 RepID=UPI00349EB8C0|nr:head-tail connector protein [Aquamicrobium sp.]MCO5158961.1 head-tail connector protein [Aquamicrobium sp.]
MAIVDLEDVKSHLGILDDADDSLISGKINAAQAWLESQLGYSIEDEYGGDSPVYYPADLVEAVRQMTAHMYENREATVVGLSITETPAAVADTIRNHRRYWGFPNGSE